MTTMTCKTGGFRFALLLASAALFLPPGASGQAQAFDPDRAATLEAEARALHDLPPRWNDAARLYREAAELREDDDEVKVHNLRMATRMAHYAGRQREALENAEAAGRLALRRGELVEAGQALADAAYLAHVTGNRDRAHALSEEVRLLAGSPLLAAADREHLLRRIGEAA
jgi:hypothetical protein